MNPRRQHPSGRIVGPDNKPIGAKPQTSKVEPSRIVLRYLDVKVNPPIKPELFGWQPPADAKEWEGVANKFDEHFSSNPGSGD